MLYLKNLPAWERLLRNAVGLALVAYALLGTTGPWTWVLVVAAVILILTGVVGFCPACALAGRRLAKRNSPAE